MKQHIEIKQLEQLTKEQKIKLCSMTYNYDIFLTYKLQLEEISLTTLKIKAEICQQLNIGQMIKILIDNIPQTDSIEDSLDIECDRVTKRFLVEYKKDKSHFIEYENKELSNALWEAIKEIL